VGLAAYAAYLLVRRRVWTDEGRDRAQRNAAKLFDLEQRAHLACEPTVQRWALRRPRLVDALNAAYAVANVGLTVGWLMRLHRARDGGFARERTAALAAFAGALPFFALAPVAPPRTLDGFVDTMARGGLNLDHPLVRRFYNPIAAMPSLHLAFAVVTGGGLAARARSPWARAGWSAYPAGVAAVVVATGNHLVVDVAAGATLGAVARAVTR
jgi:hypothetical protein